jgi:hypothetical protein
MLIYATGYPASARPNVAFLLPRTVIASVLILISAFPALGEIRILASPGGTAAEFTTLFEQIERTGERVVIDGPCFSACTLVLSIVPSERICVTRRAVLGFHAARWLDQKGRTYAAPEATRVVTATYPLTVQTWIEQHGGLTAKPILLRGRQLAALYPRCS